MCALWVKVLLETLWDDGRLPKRNRVVVDGSFREGKGKKSHHLHAHDGVGGDPPPILSYHILSHLVQNRSTTLHRGMEGTMARYGTKDKWKRTSWVPLGWFFSYTCDNKIVCWWRVWSVTFSRDGVFLHTHAYTNTYVYTFHRYVLWIPSTYICIVVHGYDTI